MTHSELQVQGLTPSSHYISSSIRAQIIDRFLGVKQKSSMFCRETIFTALAVYQKYMLKKNSQKVKNQQTQQHRVTQIAACLWISIKVECHEKNILTKILHLFEISMAKQQIILAEAEILQTIDFQIPLTHAYTSMILEFNRRSLQTTKNNVQLVAQCLAFYGEAIRISSDFVLDGELGANIVVCLADRCISDPRIRQACRSIRRNRNINSQPLQVSPQTNIRIKVCQ